MTSQEYAEEQEVDHLTDDESGDYVEGVDCE